jgi:hypothetical protein
MKAERESMIFTCSGCLYRFTGGQGRDGLCDKCGREQAEARLAAVVDAHCHCGHPLGDHCATGTPDGAPCLVCERAAAERK